ncbi:uncharacterized protein LOC144883528 isoform X2 [Branchiostoma floridae x Branchiostoma japonicum]
MLSGVSALVTTRLGCITTASLVSLLCVTKVQVAASATPTCQRPRLTEVIQRGLTTQAPDTSSPMDKLSEAKQASLWGLLIGDALSMPVHWYYDADDIKRDYGKWLTGYVAPRKQHPSSIMSLSATGGSGRSGFSTRREEPLIGNVILHDKLQYWTNRGGAVHYHQGMSAGDSTLNALCALKVCQTMTRVDPDNDLSPRDLRSAVLADYVQFLTTPGTHNDTYAESFHRAFFRDWIQAGKPITKDGLIDFAERRHKEQSAGSADSQLAVIGAFVMAVPFVLHSAHLSEAEAVRNTVDFVRLTHPLPPHHLEPFLELYVKVLHAVLNGANLQEKAAEALQSPVLGGSGTWKRVQTFSSEAAGYAKGSDSRLSVYQEAVGRFGLACYIKGSLTSLFFLAHEFHDDMEGGVLTNTNVGGENCHRGAALGALLAAGAGSTGKPLPQGLKDGLGSARTDLMALLANSKL